MNNWNKQTETPLPFNSTLILSNDKDRIIGLVEHELTTWNDGSKHEFFWLRPEGISGYDWETDFAYKNITHWMEAPSLP